MLRLQRPVFTLPYQQQPLLNETEWHQVLGEASTQTEKEDGSRISTSTYPHAWILIEGMQLGYVEPVLDIWDAPNPNSVERHEDAWKLQWKRLESL